MYWRSPNAATQLQAFLVEVVPVQDHGFLRDLAERVSKEAPDPAGPIRNQQQRPEHAQCQLYHHLQLPEQHSTDAAEVAVACSVRKGHPVRQNRYAASR